MKKLILISLVTLLAIYTAACGTDNTTTNSTKEQNQETLTVYTTVYPLTYFTERIGGNLVNVKSVYPAGSNEHTFDPTQKDMMALAEADLFFYIGLGLEGFVENAKKTLATESVTLISTADSVSDKDLNVGTSEEENHDDAHAEESTEESHDEHAHDEESTEEEHATEEGHDEHAHSEDSTEEEHATEEGHDEHAHSEESTEEEHATEEEGHNDEHAHDEESTEAESHDDHAHGEIDYHLWISPQISVSLATSIKDSLIEKDSENKATYTENYDALVQDLEQLDADFKEMANASKNKTFFVSHSAFGYLAEPYGLEQVAVAGLNSQNEPSQKELTELVELAKDKNIKTILFEQNVSSKLTKVIQNEIGADALSMHNLGVLTQQDIDNKETYFTLMEQNLETLKKALDSSN
ncbi:metal ABC transporter solute-binding protein, Zn/Mn family [Paenisporosarcina sp. TG20]|uniref:metal ABC transporter solute-binding protein, Zn/Mn family n=1 Tax=Paenisporosarcina sp. TG20 TaxID=1211706 RepID=UPI00030E2EA4|nr:zinc ABC transporter substrate-binding protein [Paenisporosarcina sp. TG20]